MSKAMKYLIRNNVLQGFAVRMVAALAMVVLAVGVAMAQDTDLIPDAPNPPRLVNDFASIFTAEQVAVMEDSLETFARKTSNRIAVVTMADLRGLEPMEMAYGIGKKWGVGDKEHNAGVVILVKPKSADSRGEVFIATGYGVEGVLTDAFCSDIIRNEMIPHFRNNDYYGGVDAALKIIKPAMQGEFSREQYLNSGDDDILASIMLSVLVLIVVFALISILTDSKHNDDNNSKGNGGTFGGGGPIIFLPGMGHRSSGGFGGGGFGGGFGGFGGGSFGGGGAGGSW